MTSSRKPVRDSLYYWDSITFLVEGVLFKVPRRYFEKNSDFWSDVFALPLGNNINGAAEGCSDGCSDENPIRLESIKKIDFQRLLKVIYPEDGPQSHRMIMDVEEWKSVLKLSTLWEFDDIEERAIAELSKLEMDPVDKVILARSYMVGDWLLEGYITLVERDASLSSEDAKRLGYETAFRLSQRREDTFKKPWLTGPELAAEIRTTFRAELLGLSTETRRPNAWNSII